MELKKPIIFLDIESTGADALRDRIIEIALIKRNHDHTIAELVERINPGVRIPAEAIAIHHITNEDVAGAPPFKEIAPTLLAFMEGCDLGGFGISRFDITILKEEFKRCGIEFSTEGRSLIDALTIFHQKERRDLSAAYQFYCAKALEGAHGAKADAIASMEVFFAQVEKYGDLPREIEGLHLYCNKQDERFVDSQRKLIWKDGEAVFNFGKHKGESLSNMVKKQSDYIEWVVRDGKFAQDMIDICWKALRGEFPSQGAAPKKVESQTSAREPFNPAFTLSLDSKEGT